MVVTRITAEGERPGAEGRESVARSSVDRLVMFTVALRGLGSSLAGLSMVIATSSLSGAGVPKMACLNARTAKTGAGVSGGSANASVVGQSVSRVDFAAFHYKRIVVPSDSSAPFAPVSQESMLRGA